MAAASYRVEAEWDDEARLWITTSDDIPGLCVEVSTLEELTAVVVELAPTLLVANGLLTEAAREVPLVIAAERHAVVSLAA